MSAQQMSNALRVRGDARITPVVRLVFAYVCDRANGAGVCWPLVDEIAWELDISRRSVLGALKLLNELRYIEAVRHAYKPSTYRIIQVPTPPRYREVPGAKSAPYKPAYGANPAPASAPVNVQDLHHTDVEICTIQGAEFAPQESIPQVSPKNPPRESRAADKPATRAHKRPSAKRPAEKAHRKIPIQTQAFEFWGWATERSRLVKCHKPDKVTFAALRRALAHPALDDDLTRWQAYVRWLAEHPRYGGRDWPASVLQATRHDWIDRWASVMQGRPIVQPVAAADDADPPDDGRDAIIEEFLQDCYKRFPGPPLPVQH